MTKQPQRRSAQCQFQVALEAATAHKTLSQLAREYNVHPTPSAQGKRQLLEDGRSLCGQQRPREPHARSARAAALYEQLGRLKLQLAWLTKKADRFSCPATGTGRAEPSRAECAAAVQLVGVKPIVLRRSTNSRAPSQSGVDAVD